MAEAETTAGRRTRGRAEARKAPLPGAATLLLATALAGAPAACDSGPAEPAASPDEAALLMAITTETRTMLPAERDDSEPYVHACPNGGRLVVEGGFERDREDGASVHRWDQLVRYEGCGLSVRQREYVADGELHLFGEAGFGPAVNGRAPVVRQQSHQRGSLTTRHEGEVSTCDYDLSIAFDRSAGDYHITGTACGRAVDFRAPASPGGRA